MRAFFYMSPCISLGLSTAPTSVDRSDGLKLHGVRITNAVKCLPPENKPLPTEIQTCNQYLAAELENLKSVSSRAGAGPGGARGGPDGLRPEAQRGEIRARRPSTRCRMAAS